MDQWARKGAMDDWMMTEWLNDWMNEWMNEWINEWSDGCTYGSNCSMYVVTWSQPLQMHYKDRSYTHDIRSDRSIKLNKNS